MTATFDLRPLERHFRGCPRAAQRRLRRVLAKHGKALVSSVRRRKTIFDRTNTHRGQTPLQRAVWTSQEARPGCVTQEAGWDVAHGPILEHGPIRKRRWTIPGPVGWKQGGKVKWANEVERTWDRGQLRPHFAPAMKRIEPKFNADVAKVLVETVGGR